MAIVATVGAANANSYLTVEQADAYLADRLGAEAWAALDGQKETALKQATRELDRHRFKGCRANSDQALQFPRLEQKQLLNEIPPEVKQACAEQALWLAQHAANGGRSDRQQLRQDGVTAWAVGDASETLGPGGGGSLSSLCPDARALLARWISRTGRLLSDRERPATARRWSPLT